MKNVSHQMAKLQSDTDDATKNTNKKLSTFVTKPQFTEDLIDEVHQLIQNLQYEAHFPISYWLKAELK